jgi:hypothetical protein
VAKELGPFQVHPWLPPAFTTYTFTLSGVTVGNTYKLTIKGGKDGVRDVNENYMKEDYVQYIQFPL